MADEESPQPSAQHVEPRGEQWAVRKEGAKQASQLFNTKQEAEDRALRLAQEQDSEVVVHDSGGEVQKRFQKF